MEKWSQNLPTVKIFTIPRNGCDRSNFIPSSEILSTTLLLLSTHDRYSPGSYNPIYHADLIAQLHTCLFSSTVLNLALWLVQMLHDVITALRRVPLITCKSDILWLRTSDLTTTRKHIKVMQIKGMQTLIVITTLSKWQLAVYYVKLLSTTNIGVRHWMHVTHSRDYAFVSQKR